MKSLRRIVIISCIIIINLMFSWASFAGNNCVSSHNIEPLAEEVYFIELINRARANPEAEAKRYNIALNEGVNSSSTISNTPKQPLAFNIDLYKAALAHSEDMLLQDYFSHYTYPNNASPQDRVVAQGYNYYSGENIAINMSTGELEINQNTAAYHHEILFVDEDYPNRGHRVNMFSSSHSEVGVGLAHGDYKDWDNSVVSTTNFGRGEKSAYICGVIYNDKNGNQFYDVGEGVPHATLTIVETGQSVDAFSAGAYSLGLNSSGTFTVEAYLCEYNATTTKVVSIGNDNVKVDFLLSDFPNIRQPDEPDDIDNPDDASCKSLSISEIITPKTSDDFNKIPIKVSSGTNTQGLPFFLNNSFMNMEIKFPCYTQPVDTYIAIVFPDGTPYFLSKDGRLTLAFDPFSTNTTEARNISLKITSLYKGDYVIYWASVPTNGGDIFSVNWGGYSELGYLTHSIK
ncbi:MAG: CAP domain-containing protein [Desulfamplus sp.]|nr:CAP domain-containing protein [Desulfamplus sp.]